MLDAFDQRHEPRADGRRDRRRAPRGDVSDEIQEARRRRLRRAAGRRPGQCRRLQDMIEDRGNLGAGRAARRCRRPSSPRATPQPGLVGVFTSFRANTPLAIPGHRPHQGQVDGRLAQRRLQHAAGLPGLATTSTISTLFGRTWQVNVQADAALPQHGRGRQQAEGPQRRRADGAAGTLADVRNISGPVMVIRYNMYPAAADQRRLAPGISSGQAIALMERDRATKQLPASMAYEWTELTLPADPAGNTAMYVFALAVVLVFLVLAAQYESWSLPLAVILVVPMCLLCSIAGVAVTRHGHQHLHADRLRRAGRPGQQERHPDRRVRQAAAARPACRLPRGHAGGLPAAAAADHDDLVRLHPGRGAAGASPQGPGPKCAARWARPSSAACSASRSSASS